MKTAVNEFRKCNTEGSKWKSSGPPQERAKRPSSMGLPELRLILLQFVEELIIYLFLLLFFFL